MHIFLQKKMCIYYSFHRSLGVDHRCNARLPHTLPAALLPTLLYRFLLQSCRQCERTMSMLINTLTDY